MPIHSFRCPKSGHVFDALQTLDKLDDTMACGECKEMADKVFLKFPMSFVRQDICYDSPIDGRPITTNQERINDLARADCVPYEPGIKQDQERKKRETEEALERSFDETVEREIAVMPSRKLEKLAAELEGGLTAEPTRVTPPQQSFRDSA